MVQQSRFADEFEKDLSTLVRPQDQMADMRQRKTAVEPTKVSTRVEIEDRSASVVSVIDILRVLFVLIGVVSVASYYVTSGDSFILGLPRPWFTKPAEVSRYFQGPINLTPSELVKYDGTDPSLPILLAVNGTIFDVSAGAHTYGPGGSYHPFAGHDASRAFVTGCFMEDRTSDLKGAEDTYLPVEDPDEAISSAERKTRAERERRLARKKVRDEVNKWHDFYKNSKKYFEVGKVIYTLDDPMQPAKPLCEHAQKGRPKRKNMNAAQNAPGKPVQ